MNQFRKKKCRRILKQINTYNFLFGIPYAFLMIKQMIEPISIIFMHISFKFDLQALIMSLMLS